MHPQFQIEIAVILVSGRVNVENCPLEMIEIIIVNNNRIQRTPSIIVTSIPPPVKMEQISPFIISITNEGMPTLLVASSSV